MAFKVVSGSFTATGQSPAFEIPGGRGPATNEILFNVTIYGTFSATVVIERSFDNSTWHQLSKDADGNAASYTAPVSLKIGECETPVYYQLNCTAYTSGEAFYRISQ